jgi:hypothetical protein
MFCHKKWLKILKKRVRFINKSVFTSIMEDNEQKTSKFSSGLNIIIRLDELWRDTHKHSRDGKYNSWNADLDRIWLELARDYDEEKEKEFLEKEELFNKFDKKIENIGRIKDKSPDGFEELSEKDIKNRNEHYKILMEKQLFLARLENELGKGTTYNEGDDDDFD